MYSKNCTGCEFTFTFASKPHKELTAICPTCSTEVSLADAKPLTQTTEAKVIAKGAQGAPKEAE